MKFKSQHGFTIVEILLTLLIVAVIGFVGYYVWHSQHKTTPAKAAITNSTSTPSKSSSSDSTKAQAPSGIVVATTDNTAQFSLPTTWKVVQRHNGADGQQYCGFATAESTQGTCLLDVTYQPTAFDTGNRTFWYTKFFETTKTPSVWNSSVVGSCESPQDTTINGYQELICKDDAGGTEYIISNGQHLAYFADTATGKYAQTDGSAKYESDFLTILSSIKFN